MRRMSPCSQVSLYAHTPLSLCRRESAGARAHTHTYTHNLSALRRMGLHLVANGEHEREEGNVPCREMRREGGREADRERASAEDKQDECKVYR